jgi:hypothetical protein
VVSRKKAVLRRSATRGGGPGAVAGAHGCPVGRRPGRGVVCWPARWLLAILAGVLLLPSALPGAGEGPTYLKAPGLRLKKDPSVVIPEKDFYANRPISLPHYRDAAGDPAEGWSRKFIATRRFKSDQSAWIYYRRQDLRKSIILHPGPQGNGLCIWPGGTLIVIESYRGGKPDRQRQAPVEIGALSKADHNAASPNKVFLPAEWSYARFTPKGERSISGAKVHQCHQCHGIAFQLTGDLVFTRFP